MWPTLAKAWEQTETRAGASVPALFLWGYAMGRHLVSETWENDIRVRTWYDDTDDQVTYERSQDVQNVVDMVAASNLHGNMTVDGLGKPIGEIPVATAIDWCAQRGIPWEKMLYTNEYDDQMRMFIREHKRLAYENTKTVHTVQ